MLTQFFSFYIKHIHANIAQYGLHMNTNRSEKQQNDDYDDGDNDKRENQTCLHKA